jgi:hypothetical protein
MEASEITIIHGDKSVTMTGEEFAAATSPRIKEKEFRDVLRCELTKEELDDLAGSLAEQQLELQELEEQKKAVTKDFAGKIEAVQARIRSGKNTFRQRWEMREVECIEVKSFLSGELYSKRLDTGEVLKRRKLTSAELERELPIEVPKNDPEQ